MLVSANAPASPQGLLEKFAEALRFANLHVCDSAATEVRHAVSALLQDNHTYTDHLGELSSPGSRCKPPANGVLEFLVAVCVSRHGLAAHAPGPQGNEDNAAARGGFCQRRRYDSSNRARGGYPSPVLCQT